MTPNLPNSESTTSSMENGKTSTPDPKLQPSERYIGDEGESMRAVRDNKTQTTSDCTLKKGAGAEREREREDNIA